jgi:tetratricopeptide (TPR) repeat protein
LIRRLLNFLRLRVSDNEKNSSLELALQILNVKLPSPDWDQAGWQLWEQLAPHYRTLLGHLRNHPLEAKATRVMNDLASWLENRAEYDEAELLYRQALAILEKALGPEHPNVATSLNNLAELYRAQGRYTRAELLLRRAFAILERALGFEHPLVATSLNNLATLLQTTNRLSDAEALFRRALAIREKALGPEHPKVATCLENYAGLLLKMDRLEEAGQLEARAMAIRAKNAATDS